MCAVEPIFPLELRRRVPQEFTIPGSNATWHRPVTLSSLLHIKHLHPTAKLVVGNTEVGIEMRFKQAKYPALIGVTHVPELNQIKVDQDGVTFGASVSLSKVMEVCKGLVQELPGYQTGTLRAVAEQLRWFAGPPIRYISLFILIIKKSFSKKLRECKTISN